MSYNELKLDRRDHKVLRSIFKSGMLDQLPEDHPLRVATTFKEKMRVCYDQVKDGNKFMYFTSENSWDDTNFRKWSAKFDPSSAFGDDVTDIQELTCHANGLDLPPLAGYEWITEEPYVSREGERLIKLDLRMQEGNSYLAARAKWWMGLTIAGLAKLGLVVYQRGLDKPRDYDEASLVYGHLIKFIRWIDETGNDVDYDESSSFRAEVRIFEIWFNISTGVCGVSESQELEIEAPELERELEHEYEYER